MEWFILLIAIIVLGVLFDHEGDMPWVIMGAIVGTGVAIFIHWFWTLF